MYTKIVFSLGILKNPNFDTHTDAIRPQAYSRKLDAMDCDSEPRAGGPWHHVNLQHGLLDWTLGELYGIPDYRASREQGRGLLSVTADMIERLAARSVEAGRSTAGDVLILRVYQVG